MSGESTPILCGAVPAFESFMSKWEEMQGIASVKHLVKPGLEWAYKYYRRMDRTRAYIITMGQ